MSDTPRTDAVTSYIPLSQLARQLERELAEARSQYTGLQSVWSSLLEKHAILEAERDALDEQQAQATARLVAERDAAMKDAERLNWIFENGYGVRRKYNARQNLVCWVDEGRPAIDRKMREEVEQRAAIDAGSKPSAIPT